MTNTLKAIIWILIVSMFGRGSDYVLTPPERKFGVFGADERMMPEVWGISLIVGAVFLSYSMLSVRIRWIINGAVIGCAMYGALAIQTVPHVLTPPLDGWRLSIDLFCRSALWGVIAGTLSFRYDIAVARRARQKTEGEAASE